jgi:polyphosphate kinase
LDRRVELLIPLTDNEVRAKIMNILFAYFKDTFNTYIMDDKGKYKLLSNGEKFNLHEYFMKQAINNFKLKNIPKIPFKNKKK